MNKTKIEWCDYTWNPIVGCRNACWYCYAKKIYERFYPREEFSEIHYYPERLKLPYFVKKPSRVFVGSMTDIMDSRIGIQQRNEVFEVVEDNPHHTFIFLTKCTYAYMELKSVPDNCWMGITDTGEDPMYIRLTRMAHLTKKSPGKIKFISFEPLLGDVAYQIPDSGIDWIIIGGLTGKYKDYKYKIKRKFIKDIKFMAEENKIPLFIKDNLKWGGKIQNFPG